MSSDEKEVKNHLDVLFLRTVSSVSEGDDVDGW